jgi:hypothetical protein
MLVGTRRVDAYRRARAVQTLYSHHDIGGYEVQGEDVERRRSTAAGSPSTSPGSHQERMLWQAVAEERYSSGCAPQLDADVARLLASFPPPARASRRANHGAGALVAAAEPLEAEAGARAVDPRIHARVPERGVGVVAERVAEFDFVALKSMSRSPGW